TQRNQKRPGFPPLRELQEGPRMTEEAGARPPSPFGGGFAEGADIVGDLEDFQRSERVAVEPDFIMKMRARAAAGTADIADRSVDGDFLPGLHQNLAHMAVTGDEAIAVINLDK